MIDVFLIFLRIADPTRNSFLDRTHAQRRLIVPERNIEESLGKSSRLTAIDAFPTHCDRTFVGIEIGRVGDVFDQAAFRSGAVQSALRTAQYLNPLQIV